jgi:hypothetical protein
MGSGLRLDSIHGNLIRNKIGLNQLTSILTSADDNGGFGYLRNQAAIVRNPDHTQAVGSHRAKLEWKTSMVRPLHPDCLFCENFEPI